MLLIFTLFVLAIIVLGYRSLPRGKGRRETFQAMARQLGFRYTDRDCGIPDRYRFLDALDKGENRYAFNVLEGRCGGYPVQAFDYHYETHSTDSDGDRQTHHHYFSFFVLQQEQRFPELRIYPEGFFSKLGQMLGFDDIDFESVEFSQAFCVRSTYKKFAYDICHTQMMEYLLAHRELSIEIEGRCVAMGFSGRLDVADIPGRLAQLVEVRNLFPEYLYRN